MSHKGLGFPETLWIQIKFCRLPLFLFYLASLQVQYDVHKYHKSAFDLDWLHAKTQRTAVSMEARVIVVWKLSASHYFVVFPSTLAPDLFAIKVNKIAS